MHAHCARVPEQLSYLSPAMKELVDFAEHFECALVNGIQFPEGTSQGLNITEESGLSIQGRPSIRYTITVRKGKEGLTTDFRRKREPRGQQHHHGQ